MPGSLDEGYDGQGFEASVEAVTDPERASWEEEQTFALPPIPTHFPVRPFPLRDGWESCQA